MVQWLKRRNYAGCHEFDSHLVFKRLIRFFFCTSAHRIPAHLSNETCAMAQQPQRENADAFSILMRPQPSLASIISETSIVSNDGSLEDSMVTDACPDFRSVYIVKANTSSCPSQTNSVETHFVISKELEVQIDRILVQQLAHFAVLCLRILINRKCEFI